MDKNLVIPRREDWDRVIATVNKLNRRPDPRLRREHPWTFHPGQPVPLTNNFSALAPTGGLAWLNGSAGSDADHYGIIQPLYPGIAQTLVIVDSDIPPGGDGLGWPMDGCVHPIYDPSGICVVGQNIGAQINSWAPMLCNLGPITVVAAAVNGLSQGLLHGERGDIKMIRTGSGATDGRPIKVLIFSSAYVLTQTAPGDVTVSAAT